jgi:hypothetical protein
MSEEPDITNDQSISDTSPRTLGEMLHLWTKVLRMPEAFFRQERPRARSANTFANFLVYVAAVLVLSRGRLVSWPARIAGLAPHAAVEGAPGIWTWLVCSLPFALLFGVLGAYVGVGVIYVAARALRGTGDFQTHAYLASLFVAPLGVISVIVSYVPWVRPVASLIVFGYIAILHVRVVKVVHHLTTVRAAVAVLVQLLAVLIAQYALRAV